MLTIVLHYYNNRSIVERHLATFSAYDRDLLHSLKFLLVDDCSDDGERVDYTRLLEQVCPSGMQLTVFEVTDSIAWNQTGARNLGCHQAETDWLFCIDVDHYLEEDDAARLLEHVRSGLPPDTLFRVQRREIPTRLEISPHANTFLVNRQSFLEVGGYDEDFAGAAGHSDKYFFHLWAQARKRVDSLDDVCVYLDKNAKTRNLSRDPVLNRDLYLMKRYGDTPENKKRLNFNWRLGFVCPPTSSEQGRAAEPMTDRERLPLIQSDNDDERGTAALSEIGSCPISVDIALSSLELDPRINPVRTPELPIEYRRPDFEHHYDHQTFGYDLFWDRDRRRAHILGPVAPAGLDAEQDVEFTALPSGDPCSFTLRPGTVRHHSHYFISPPAGSVALEVRFGGQRSVRAIQPNHAATFAGRRVLLTLSKDNALEWIVDWAHFHAFHFGVDAVLLYDNGSTAYTPADVQRALATVPGLQAVIIVSWPFRFGPQWRGRYDGYWCKPAFYEHARRRLLTEAHWVLNLDVDELLVQAGETPLADLVASTRDHWLPLHRINVIRAEIDSADFPLHRNFHWTELGREAHPKYLAFPNRMPDEAEWDVQGVRRAGSPRGPSATEFRICHFLPLTTGWAGRNGRMKAVDLTSGKYVEDLVLRARLDEAFTGWTPQVRAWSPLEAASPSLARLHAEAMLEQGDPAAALLAVDHAISLAPDDVRHQELREQINGATSSNAANPGSTGESR